MGLGLVQLREEMALGRSTASLAPKGMEEHWVLHGSVCMAGG